MPGPRGARAGRPFQHPERYYFEPGPDGFGVWRAFGGLVGMMICNDRRWPETYRVMGLQGVELILCGYNTPIHYAPDPSQDILQGFHNAPRDAGRRLPERHVGGRRGQGRRRGGRRLAGPERDRRPVGPDRRPGVTTGDELIVARCDLDWCARYKGTLFDFDRYRRPEHVRADHGASGAGRPDRPRPIADAARRPRRCVATSSLTTVEPSTIEFTLNGTPVTVRADHPHLLAALREELDVTSPKDGCSPSGQCGCCTVLVDGKAVVSCQLPLDKVAGKVDRRRWRASTPTSADRFADAFAACGGLQCGFCIPGIVMRAKAQIDKKGADLDPRRRWPATSAPTCAGAPATSRSSTPSRPSPRARRSTPELAAAASARSGAKYEAGELALGDRGYIDDIRVPGMLHAALHLTDHARADVRAHRHVGGRARPPGVVGGVHRRRHPRRAARRASSTRTGR